LQKGANVNAKITATLYTPIHIIFKQKNLYLLDLLTKFGGSLSLQDSEGNTPIHYAIKYCRTLLSKSQLKQMALRPDYVRALNMKNKKGLKPKDMAAVTLIKKCSGTSRNQCIGRFRTKNLSNKEIHRNLYTPIGNRSGEMRGGSVTLEKSTVSDSYKVLESYEAIKLLGRGSFGEVYLVRHKETNKIYAMKVVYKVRVVKSNLMKYILTEKNVLARTNHPFIVRLLSSFQTKERLFLIMEYCPGGDLSQHLLKEKRFSEDRARIYLAEVLLAIEDLHRRNIIYRDLKPDNVILDKDGHAMLTDFGLSKEGIIGPKTAKSFCGSIAYLAPEVLTQNGHGKSVDWYLLGVFLYEMLTGKPPYFSQNRDELFRNIIKAHLKFPPYLSITAKSLITEVFYLNNFSY